MGLPQRGNTGMANGAAFTTASMESDRGSTKQSEVFAQKRMLPAIAAFELNLRFHKGSLGPIQPKIHHTVLSL